MLEAVARAAADDPRALVLGMASRDEVGVRRQLVAAAAALLERRVRERGEAAGEVLAHDGLGRAGPGKLRVRVQRRALLVEGDLDPEVVEVASAVHRQVVVDEAGRAWRAPGGPAVEEEQLLLGDLERDELAEQAAEPGPARPDDGVALQALAVDERAACHRR